MHCHDNPTYIPSSTQSVFPQVLEEDVLLHLTNRGARVSGDSVTITWGISSPRGVAQEDATYQCNLDSGGFVPCEFLLEHLVYRTAIILVGTGPSPYEMEGLSAGEHSLAVRPDGIEGCVRRIARTFTFQV